MTGSQQCIGLLCCVATGLALLASLATEAEAAKTKDPFYIIAHMANSQAALDWAVKQGANAIEVDIQFDGSGNPRKFEHGGTCDCSCKHPVTYHICSGVLKNQCSGKYASNSLTGHLKHLAKLRGVALFFIDGKVNPGWGRARLSNAGSKLVKLLEKNLFPSGYRGKVVISAAAIKSYDFVRSAAMAAARTGNRNRYFFTFDQEENKYQSVVTALAKFTKNRVYGTGAGSCSSGSAAYAAAIKQAVNGVRSGKVGISYIYTVDKEASMKTYIDLGVHGIMTNRVGLLKKLAKSKGLRIAKPGDKIRLARG